LPSSGSCPGTKHRAPQCSTAQSSAISHRSLAE
jgi:hypothetical protein